MGNCPKCGAVQCYCDQDDDLHPPLIPIWIGFAIALLIVIAAATGCGGPAQRRRVYPPLQPAPLPGELQPQQNPG